MKSKLTNALRTTALVIAIAGAFISAWLTMHKGRNNPSSLLITAFVAWVLSPYVAFIFTTILSKQWSENGKRSFYILVLVITILSILLYNGMVMISSKTAFVFLVVPFISWLLLGITFLVNRKASTSAK